MAQNFASRASFEDEGKFGFGRIPSHHAQEFPPGRPMRRMTVNQDAVHVEDDGVNGGIGAWDHSG
jgi:hypothetical protein